MEPSTKTLVVYLTDLGGASTAGPVILAELRAGGRGELSVAFREGQYRLTDLDRWRNALLLGPNAGVVLGEVDERNNRVRIGITRENARTAVLQEAARIGAPAAALQIDVVETPVPFVTLQDRIRPMRAGTQITMVWEQEGGQHTGGCTYGPILVYQNVRHMVTNSHCTQITDALHPFGGLVGAWGTQSTNVAADWYGTEVQDPPLFSTPQECPSGQSCRYSDAALIRVGYCSPGIPDCPPPSFLRDTTSDWGYIARPAARTTLPTIYGSLTIDGVNPRLALSGIATDIFIGDTLEKVGQRTGWSGGVVTNVSSVVADVDGTRLDNVRVSAGAGHGDSGSPVFWKGGNGLYYLAGILWGGVANIDGIAGDNYWLSKWSNVDYELGSVAPDLQPVPTLPPPPPPPPPPPCEPPQCIDPNSPPATRG